MVKIFVLIALLPHLCCTVVLHGTSPCSEYFTYLRDLTTIDMLGQVEIPSPSINEEFYLKVIINAELSSDQIPSLKRFARLELARSIEESVRAVQQNRPLLYYIYFPSHLNPTLSAIWFNNQKYCSASSGNLTAIELGHIVYPPNGEPLSQNFQPWHRNSSSYLNLDHSIQEHNTNNNNNNNNNNNECGITSYYTDSTNSLMSYGEHTLPGQWPWLVAIFTSMPYGNGYDFLCAGTILTNRHILTAADCLILTYLLTIPLTIPFSNLKVGLRLFNFRRIQGIVNREVASYKIHSDYRPAMTMSTFVDTNLAIVILKTPVEFNHFIKPICLWSGSTNFENVVDRTGYIVGWGPNEFCDNFDIESRMLRVPITSQEICLRNHQVVATFMSERTSCIRLPDETDPCYQFSLDGLDWGSGLMLFDDITGRYQLRGVILRFLRVNNLLYNLSTEYKYIIYIDVTKFIPWIQEQISTT